ncbi:MAG: alkaline phosphatase D family protein, partial [Planctomycetota bacterium]|nr:alkaline phosphatase D family protein [Planctomycetota bacterium]
MCIQADVRAESTDLVTIVFGSCARQDRPAPIWATMASNKPLMTVLLGDNIYADTKDMELMRAKYQMLASNLGFQSLRKSSPIMAVWDDHDYGMDDAGANYPQREASKKIILDFFEEPEKSARRSQAGGIYTSRVLGQEGKRIQIILLDTRYSRSDLKKAQGGSQTGYIPDSSSNAVMLSPEQWIWLEEQLKQPAEVRLIGSSIQVVSEDHRFEKWANMPAERSRLFETIRKSGANGVVILSGDRHLGEISSMDAGLGY